mmetsp:Transcript_3188/g.9766  ORF Transcript_3188/g.9766 Transcript_3188/m.9766 type:complete len:293 (+) Transcript_3188:808-1686(+)
MDPETGANAVAHLDHNLGTKNRQWTMSLSTAEYLCAADTPGGFCNKKLQRALVTLRNRPTTWEGWSHGKRSKLLRTVLTAACEEYKATGPHAPAISFHATAVAKRVLRQDGPKPLSALAGTPLVLVNCSDAPDIRDWQTWSVAHRCRGGLKTCSSPYSVLSLRGPSRALGRAGIRDGLCLAIAGTRSARQPYAVLAALAPCNEVEDVASSAGRSSPVMRPPRPPSACCSPARLEANGNREVVLRAGIIIRSVPSRRLQALSSALKAPILPPTPPSPRARASASTTCHLSSSL